MSRSVDRPEEPDPYQGLGSRMPDLRRRLDDLNVGWAVPYRGVPRVDAIILAQAESLRLNVLLATFAALELHLLHRRAGQAEAAREWLISFYERRLAELRVSSSNER